VFNTTQHTCFLTLQGIYIWFLQHYVSIFILSLFDTISNIKPLDSEIDLVQYVRISTTICTWL